MAVTKQAATVAAANNLVGLMQRFQSLRTDAQAYVNTYNSEGWNNVWSTMPTFVFNNDGSTGAVDASPNVTHPIIGLNKTATQLISGVTCLQQYLNFCTNVAVATAQYSQTIDDLSV